jgi:hypothetical protein
MASGGVGVVHGADRDHAMSAAIQAAMHVLAEAPPGEIAIISACRGAPLCSAQDRASCAMCECVAVSEEGVVGYPGSGRA